MNSDALIHRKFPPIAQAAGGSRHQEIPSSPQEKRHH
jgi:hypothetical protein